MRARLGVGRVYRRCGCRDEQHHQLGSHCLRLNSEPDHGTWTFAVEIPATTSGGHNHTVRRGGFLTENEARTALNRYVTGRRIGVSADPNQTLADYLTTWLAAKKLRLKPTTWVRYRDYVENDLIPVLGAVPLDDLAYEHVLHLVKTQLAAGRGQSTIWHILATLSSALGEAVRTHRLSVNVARPTVIPRPRAAEREIWTLAQAVTFLRYCRTVDAAFAVLVEFLICTGLRRGEALALHWRDAHLKEGVVFVRWTLSAIDNNTLSLTKPKTPTSRQWVALSPRARHLLTAMHERGADPEAYVFHRPDGSPLHPEYVLNHFHQLTHAAGLPRCTVHDLRHLAVTTAVGEGVDITIVSKTVRHASVSTTADLYAHLTHAAARQAVDAIARALAREDRRQTRAATRRQRRSQGGYDQAA
ncbi:site-specific integrase [Kitasatospora albolonga]|uniref:tyrosine-type recombinase/integrase n=1 Tax=Kitasatospora albolonga TaxID=68173 RepID=UPI0031EBC4A5